MLHTQFTALCVIDTDLLAMKFSHRGNGIWVVVECSFTSQQYALSTFLSCDLDLMTFIYELDPYCLEIYWMWKYELPMLNLSKVIVWQANIHTYRQTDTTAITYHDTSQTKIGLIV